ncbi:MAG: hypothetical protein LLF78_03890 [Synergistaceae bacterium]|nr:hypothetical protein [Synergistaceae bacterium]
MKNKLFLIITLILLIFPATAYAIEEALPLDFIFKGGEYKETFHLTVDKPYKSTIPGPDGIPIIFDYSGSCELTHTFTDHDGIETYTAPKGIAHVRSGSPHLPAKGYTMGLLYDPKTSDISWFVNDINGDGTQKLWTRELSADEYALIGTQFTITARTDANALLIQYSGTMPYSDDIVFDITDTNTQDKFSKEIIKSSSLPGYFQISGGILYIQKLVMEDDIPILYYEWSKQPKL